MKDIFDSLALTGCSKIPINHLLSEGRVAHRGEFYLARVGRQSVHQALSDGSGGWQRKGSSTEVGEAECYRQYMGCSEEAER